AAILIIGAPMTGQAKIPKDTVKIGILQEMPRPYADRTGRGALVAAQLAASDFETEHMRGEAEILPGKARTSATGDLDEVKTWLEKEDVAAVISSASADENGRLAKLLQSHNRTLLIAGSAEERSSEPCGPNVVVWGAGSRSRANALAHALVPDGGKRWFLVAEQTPAGVASAAALEEAVDAAGGKIVGRTDPVPGGVELQGDMKPIEQAGAQVVALSILGPDLAGALRDAQLGGLTHRAVLASPFATVQDVDQAGAAAAEGLVVAAPFYWDANARTRRFAKRWDENRDATHVSENAAYVYAAALSFMHAARSVDDIAADKVIGALRHAPIDDTLFGQVHVTENGRVRYDIGVYRVKAPSDIQKQWAYLSKIKSVPADAAFDAKDCAER
ncbi:MAG: ABC transporter substrate-binding protein, partial [Rhodospirillales bacterium]|nr:ABC transporter substrate-binding protein [Rhodospirillales bacterium]